MSENNDQTNPGTPEFDFSRYPPIRSSTNDEPGAIAVTKKLPPPVRNSLPTSDAHPERRAKKDRRRRIDPTTFDKQYTDDEMEFMNAMQRFKETLGQELPDLPRGPQGHRRPGLSPRHR